MQRLLAGGLILAGLLAASGCRAASGSTTPLEPQPCTIALTQHQGETPLDREIAQLQQKARTNQQPGPFLEKLGWRLVEKARVSFDPGYYKLAEQCALCIEAKANPNQQVSQRSNLTPEDAGLPRSDIAALKGGDAATNAAAIRTLLQGEPGPYRDIVLLNTAAALIVAGKADGLPDGIAKAATSIDSGRAAQALDRLVAVTNDTV